MPARFTGLPVSGGAASGLLVIAGDVVASAVTADEVSAAFASVAAERSALAERLRAAGRAAEADIVEIGALIAADSTLSGPAVAAVRDGADAAIAVRDTAEGHAAAMARLDNPVLAERAADIRQVADAVLERLAAPGRAAGPGFANGVPGAPVYPATETSEFILVRREVSPADLIQLAEAGLVGAVSVAGGASSHAAIIARGLGLPMIAGADPAVLSLPPGQDAVLDADAGELVVGEAPARASTRLAADDGPPPAGPVLTRDGREITVLCNVASAAETRRGLAAGAAGVGLLRTEIPYVQAADWPTRAQQSDQLGPILTLLADRTATVRLLDFSGDKIPPFLAAGETGTGTGLAALLAHPSALGDQLQAILEAGRDTRLAVLVPMVSSREEVARVRSALAEAAAGLGVSPPPLGIMVELQSTALNAAGFAASADFFSVGTNDLAGDVLGLGRRDQEAGPGLAAHPRVLALVRGVAEAGRAARITVSVCGDAAADRRVLPLLIGAGLTAVSVPAASVSTVRSWISKLTAAECAELTGRALLASSAAEVWDLVPAL